MGRTFFRKSLLGGVVAAVFTFAAVALAADVPQTLTHQGRLYNAEGLPVSGPLDVTFNVYGAEGDATPIWSEKIAVTFEDGYFSATLGETSPLKDVFDGSVRYVGIQVGADAEMSPRVPVNSVPYAILAGNVIGDITPTSISIGGAPVVDANGQWVGDPTGLVGPMGPEGPQGQIGPVGPAGAAGAIGPVGPTGAMGPQGVMGLSGPVGAMGPQGLMGPQGPTGAQGVAGATGAAGPQGATGATGAQGAQGLQGPTGIVTTATFAGAVPSIAGAVALVFAGPTATVTTTAGQRLTATAVAPLGFGAGALPSTALVDVCYRPQAGGNLINFAAGNYAEHRFVAERRGYSAAGSVVPGAGTWLVGLCLANATGAGANPSAISDNDYVNGWVQVTN